MFTPGCHSTTRSTFLSKTEKGNFVTFEKTRNDACCDQSKHFYDINWDIQTTYRSNFTFIITKWWVKAFRWFSNSHVFLLPCHRSAPIKAKPTETFTFCAAKNQKPHHKGVDASGSPANLWDVVGFCSKHVYFSWNRRVGKCPTIPAIEATKQRGAATCKNCCECAPQAQDIDHCIKISCLLYLQILPMDRLQPLGNVTPRPKCHPRNWPNSVKLLNLFLLLSAGISDPLGRLGMAISRKLVDLNPAIYQNSLLQISVIWIAKQSQQENSSTNVQCVSVCVCVSVWFGTRPRQLGDPLFWKHWHCEHVVDKEFQELTFWDHLLCQPNTYTQRQFITHPWSEKCSIFVLLASKISQNFLLWLEVGSVLFCFFFSFFMKTKQLEIVLFFCTTESCISHAARFL